MTASQAQAVCKLKMNCDLCTHTLRKDKVEAEKELVEFKTRRPSEDLVDKYLKLTNRQKNKSIKVTSMPSDHNLDRLNTNS